MNIVHCPGIWWSRNSAIFEQKDADARSTMLKMVAFYAEIGPMKKKQNKRSLQLRDLGRNYLVGFVDQRAYIFKELGRYYCSRWQGVKRTDIRAEITALWGFRIYAKWLGMDDQQSRRNHCIVGLPNICQAVGNG